VVMGRPPAKSEDKNVEIYLRIKPTPKASRNCTFDLAGLCKFSLSFLEPAVL